MSTEEFLDRRFGAPGRIAFRTGHCGYPEAVLANKYGSAEIALMGANVLSYRPTGHSPVVYRPAKRDFNRGDPFFGGIPFCWPQFGRMLMPGMSPHGFAKVMPFDVRSSQYTEDMTELTLGIKSSPATRELWPHDFDLELKFSVSMKLNLKATVKNTGDAPFEYSAGFHPYFLVRERDGTEVLGLDGTPYVYAEDMSNRVQTGALKMTEATDHVFSLPPAPKHEFALVDRGLGRAIAVAMTGGNSLVVWNPGPDDKLPGCDDDDWRRFVCVEPVTDWPGGATVAPGESRSLTVAIQSQNL